MTAQTHKQFAIGWIYMGGIFIYSLNISQVNYYLMLIIMIAFGKIGALFPDVDHTWRNVKEKTTINWIINKIIHLTGGKHRSWQTHSWDICILVTISCYILGIICYRYNIISNINFEIINIITMGFNLGWVSHLFSDMLTSDGVRLVCFLKFKVSFVPKSIGKAKLMTLSFILTGSGLVAIIFRLKFGTLAIAAGLGLLYMAIKLGNVRFNTGNEWEAFVYKTTKTLNKMLGVAAVIYPWITMPELKNLIMHLISRK